MRDRIVFKAGLKPLKAGCGDGPGGERPSGRERPCAPPERRESAASIPAPLRPYIDAIGEEAAATVFFNFGGAPLYLAKDPKSRSSLAKAIGRESAIALARAIGPGEVQVPIGKPWLARRYSAMGWSTAKIARHLHISTWTVRKYLRD